MILSNVHGDVRILVQKGTVREMEGCIGCFYHRIIMLVWMSRLLNMLQHMYLLQITGDMMDQEITRVWREMIPL